MALLARVFGILASVLLVVPASPALGGARASFRYRLSNFSGPVPSMWAKLAIDQEHDEIYVLNQRDHDIRVFDEHGMEIYVFGEGLIGAADIAVGDAGDIFVLTSVQRRSSVQLFDYRGEFVSEVAIANVPARLSGFTATRMVYSGGFLYLLDSRLLAVIVLDMKGSFRDAYDIRGGLMRFFEGDEEQQEQVRDLEITGFHVDRQENIYFTISALFAAFRLSPDGELTVFGRAGSAPGKFSVVAGIVADDMGRVYVSDRLRSVVLIFDEELRFQSEFGYRGDRPSNLIVPDDLAVDSRGNVYVAQAADRGVSVFTVSHQ